MAYRYCLEKVRQVESVLYRVREWLSSHGYMEYASRMRDISALLDHVDCSLTIEENINHILVKVVGLSLDLLSTILGKREEKEEKIRVVHDFFIYINPDPRGWMINIGGILARTRGYRVVEQFKPSDKPNVSYVVYELDRFETSAKNFWAVRRLVVLKYHELPFGFVERLAIYYSLLCHIRELGETIQWLDSLAEKIAWEILTKLREAEQYKMPEKEIVKSIQSYASYHVYDALKMNRLIYHDTGILVMIPTIIYESIGTEERPLTIP